MGLKLRREDAARGIDLIVIVYEWALNIKSVWGC